MHSYKEISMKPEICQLLFPGKHLLNNRHRMEGQLLIERVDTWIHKENWTLPQDTVIHQWTIVLD